MERRSALRPFLVTAIVLSGLFVAFLQVRRAWQRRHPPLGEHEAELLAAAAKDLDCARERLVPAAVPNEPQWAAVEGCGKKATFVWDTSRFARATAGGPHWRAIDPSCRVDYLGFSIPCN